MSKLSTNQSASSGRAQMEAQTPYARALPSEGERENHSSSVLSWSLLLVLLSASLTLPALAGPSSPYRGLWVGEVTLNYVTEVTTPLDANNVPIAPDPKI